MPNALKALKQDNSKLPARKRIDTLLAVSTGLKNQMGSLRATLHPDAKLQKVRKDLGNYQEKSLRNALTVIADVKTLYARMEKIAREAAQANDEDATGMKVRDAKAYAERFKADAAKWSTMGAEIESYLYDLNQAVRDQKADVKTARKDAKTEAKGSRRWGRKG